MSSLLKPNTLLRICRSNQSIILASRSMHDSIQFTRPKLQEGWLYEGDGRRYFVLKGNNLYAFKSKYVYETATAQEIFDLSIYDKVQQVSYNNNKFSLESSTQNDKKLFQTETNKEMLLWIRNIKCIQQNANDCKISFIDDENKRTPYVNH